MEILRTPEECFNNLEDYNFNENYITIKISDNLSARMHYVDVNSDSDETILLLHGEPTWSYLYRKMIPILEKSGKRIIAPDLIGFGKSDKIKEKEEYTYERHVVWTSEIISQLGLKNITLFAQDWGGLIGLRMVANHPELFDGLVLSNTWLPIGKGSSEGFDAWKNIVRLLKSLILEELYMEAQSTRYLIKQLRPTMLPFQERITWRARDNSQLLCPWIQMLQVFLKI